MSSLTLAAHAKINLSLFVGPPQPPKGYHPIRSWFAAIDLHDTVRLERRAAGEPSRADIRWAIDAPRPTPIDWPTENDLAVRAHALLEEATGRALPVHLTLEKRTPVGGGLGGGSSDAAAVLTGVNQLFELGLSAEQLRTLSGRLGSDVAFFIDDHAPPRPAIVSGFGERIDRVSRTPAELVLIFPPFGCPTAAVYQAFDQAPASSPSNPAGIDHQIARTLATGTVPSDGLFNDLTQAAHRVEPRLAELHTTLDQLARTFHGPPGAPALRVHMTGSGSTLFCMAPRGVSPAAIIEHVRPAAGASAMLATRLI